MENQNELKKQTRTNNARSGGARFGNIGQYVALSCHILPYRNNGFFYYISWPVLPCLALPEQRFVCFSVSVDC